MLSRFGNLSGKLSNSAVNPMLPSRTYKISSGRITKPQQKTMPSTINDKPETVQSDVTGYHKVGVVQVCKDQPQCHNRKCDSIHEAVCPHKKGDPKLIAELAGALTHKVPADKEGVLLDSHDAKGDPKPQYMVKEKTAVPMNIEAFKEHEKITEYVQQSNISEIIAANMAPNSILNLKNTSLVDTPLDENL